MKRKDSTNLGNVLLKMGIISGEELDRALDVQRDKDQLLGACLVFIGALTQDELELALELQEKMRGRRGVDAFLDLVEKRSEKTNQKMAMVLAGGKT